ncbi:hypothetical protein HK096_005800, partial [Nowakowskiella sp. JEL0078]
MDFNKSLPQHIKNSSTSNSASISTELPLNSKSKRTKPKKLNERQSKVGSGYSRPLQIQYTYNKDVFSNSAAHPDQSPEIKSVPILNCRIESSCNVGNTYKIIPQTRKNPSESHAIQKNFKQNLTLTELIAKTTDPVDKAEFIRKFEISQVERRFKDLGWSHISNTFNKSTYSQNSGTTLEVWSFLLPITDPDFPFDLKDNKLKLHLFVPQLYPTAKQTNIKILNDEIPSDLKIRVEKAWEKKSCFGSLTLLQLCNWLDRQLEELLIRTSEPITKITFVNFNQSISTTSKRVVDASVLELSSKFEDSTSDDQPDNSELDFSDSDSETISEPMTSLPVHRGIQIRVPTLDLTGISLLLCTSINLQIRCANCKSVTEVSQLTSANAEQSEPPRRILCKTCGTLMSIRYRTMLAHKLSRALGYLDVDLCSPVDLLLASFEATCVHCNSKAGNRYVNVGRGDRTSVCLKCHWKLGFKFDDVLFIGLANLNSNENLAPSKVELYNLKKKVAKEKILVVGLNLPENGICKHYKK